MESLSIPAERTACARLLAWALLAAIAAVWFGTLELRHLLRSDDPACLHYRSGAFVIARLRRHGGETPLFDSMLSFVAYGRPAITRGVAPRKSTPASGT